MFSPHGCARWIGKPMDCCVAALLAMTMVEAGRLEIILSSTGHMMAQAASIRLFQQAGRGFFE
jgi:hypothetical protein